MSGFLNLALFLVGFNTLFLALDLIWRQTQIKKKKRDLIAHEIKRSIHLGALIQRNSMLEPRAGYLIYQNSSPKCSDSFFIKKIPSSWNDKLHLSQLLLQERKIAKIHQELSSLIQK